MASIAIERKEPFATGRTAVLTVSENSPFTRRARSEADSEAHNEPWSDFPRYGTANAARLLLGAPVEPGRVTRLRLEIMDGSNIGDAGCNAEVYAPIDYSALPSLSTGVDRIIEGAGQ